MQKVVIEALINDFETFRQKRHYFNKHPDEVWTIFDEGSARAREVARQTMEEVRRVLGLDFPTGRR